MAADRKWVERNLGFDPISTPPPAATFAFRRAAKSASPEDLQREIIDFDSESPAGQQFLAFTTATGLSRYTERTVAQRTCAQDRSQTKAQEQQPIAAGGRVSRHMDGG